MSHKKIVIVGGGFGGVYTASYLKKFLKKELQKNGDDESSADVSITLINRSNYFLFTPLLHEVATGSLSPLSVIEPLREIFKKSSIEIAQSEVTKIDVKNNFIEAACGRINFDYLVLSPGAETNYYGIEGAEAHSVPLKSLNHALLIREKMIDAFEKASREDDAEIRKQLLSFAVVGGGPTGVECVAEMAEFISETLELYYKSTKINKKEVTITLVSSGPELLQGLHPHIQKAAQKTLSRDRVTIQTGVKVTEVTDKGMVCDGGLSIQASTIVWAAGVKPNGQNIEGLTYHPSGRICVDQYLRAEGFKNIFILGDTAAQKNPKEDKLVPMMAQVATQQSKAVAKNLAVTIRSESVENNIEKKLKPFVFKSKGNLISLGQGNAAGNIFGMTITGPLMWWIWRTIYLFKFLSWRKRVRIVIEWTINLFYPRDISRIRIN